MENGYYRTTDLALAAYLEAQGYEVTIETDSYPYTFVVTPDCQLLDHLERWIQQAATVNATSYYQAYKRLTKQCRSLRHARRTGVLP